MNKEVKKKLLIVGAIFGVVIMAIIIISIVMMSAVDSDIDGDAGAGDEIYANSAVFENRYQLNHSLGESVAALALEQISNAIFEEDELATAPHENISMDEYKNHFTVTIVETSYKKYTEHPQVFVFDIEVSDGRKYKAFVRQDTEYDAAIEERRICVTTVLLRDGTKLYKTSATNENLIKTLEKWAATL